MKGQTNWLPPVIRRVRGKARTFPVWLWCQGVQLLAGWGAAWLNQGVAQARLRPTPRNGSARRLTTAQYRNTLRELLLIEDNLADTLPPDAVSRDGFVNNQETLNLSPLLLEAYYDIAEQALERCIVDPQAKPTIQNFRMDLGTAINPVKLPKFTLTLNRPDPSPTKYFATTLPLATASSNVFPTNNRPDVYTDGAPFTLPLFRTQKSAFPLLSSA